MTQVKIPDFTLPSAILYVQSIDALLYQSAGNALDAFSITSLGKELVADKEINLNQEVVDLFCINDPIINQTFIVMVMKNEFVITDESFTLKN